MEYYEFIQLLYLMIIRFTIATVLVSVAMFIYYLKEVNYYKHNMTNWEDRLIRGDILTAENLFEQEVKSGF